MKFWPFTKQTEDKGVSSLTADYISPGSFHVFIPIKDVLHHSPRPLKKSQIKKIQYLGVLLIFVAAFFAHAYIFMERHIMKTVVAPVALLISGAFYDTVWGSGSSNDGTAKKTEEKKPDDTKNDKATGSLADPKAADAKSPAPVDMSSNLANSGAKVSPAPSANNAKGKTGEAEKKAKDAFDPLSLDETKVKILLSLNEREKELKKQEEKLHEREVSVKALEIQMQKRGVELKELKDTIEALAKSNNEYAQKNLKRLVGMYEAMKPPVAAKIFDELPQAVLLGIIKAMNEKKASAILAAMNQDKVRALTNAIALIPQVPEKEKIPPK